MAHCKHGHKGSRKDRHIDGAACGTVFEKDSIKINECNIHLKSAASLTELVVYRFVPDRGQSVNGRSHE